MNSNTFCAVLLLLLPPFLSPCVVRLLADCVCVVFICGVPRRRGLPREGLSDTTGGGQVTPMGGSPSSTPVDGSSRRWAGRARQGRGKGRAVFGLPPRASCRPPAVRGRPLDLLGGRRLGTPRLHVGQRLLELSAADVPGSQQRCTPGV